MNTKLLSINNWMYTHRTHIQIAFVLVLVSVTVIALFAPGVISLADTIGGGPH